MTQTNNNQEPQIKDPIIQIKTVEDESEKEIIQAKENSAVAVAAARKEKEEKIKKAQNEALGEAKEKITQAKKRLETEKNKAIEDLSSQINSMTTAAKNNFSKVSDLVIKFIKL